MTAPNLRERVARAIEESLYGTDRIGRTDILQYGFEADAAIAIVLEEAAKVAIEKEKERIGMSCPDGIKGCAVFHYREVQRPRTPHEIAAAIRALKDI
jgi:hypothetical protein